MLIFLPHQFQIEFSFPFDEFKCRIPERINHFQEISSDSAHGLVLNKSNDHFFFFPLRQGVGGIKEYLLSITANLTMSTSTTEKALMLSCFGESFSMMILNIWA